MGIIPADHGIVNVRDKGFDVDTNAMEVGKRYSFRFLDITYVIRKDGDGALEITAP